MSSDIILSIGDCILTFVVSFYSWGLHHWYWSTVYLQRILRYSGQINPGHILDLSLNIYFEMIESVCTMFSINWNFHYFFNFYLPKMQICNVYALGLTVHFLCLMHLYGRISDTFWMAPLKHPRTQSDSDYRTKHEVDAVAWTSREEGHEIRIEKNKF